MGVPVTTQRQVPGVVRQLRVPTVQTVQQTVEILQVPFLDWFLTCLFLCNDRCVAYVPVIMQRRVLSRCDSGGASASVHRQSGASLWTETGRYLGKTVEIPQVQFLDTVFGDLTVLFTDFGIQFGRANAVSSSRARHSMTMMKVWVMTTTF